MNGLLNRMELQHPGFTRVDGELRAPETSFQGSLPSGAGLFRVCIPAGIVLSAEDWQHIALSLRGLSSSIRTSMQTARERAQDALADGPRGGVEAAQPSSEEKGPGT